MKDTQTHCRRRRGDAEVEGGDDMVKLLEGSSLLPRGRGGRGSRARRGGAEISPGAKSKGSAGGAVTRAQRTVASVKERMDKWLLSAICCELRRRQDSVPVAGG